MEANSLKTKQKEMKMKVEQEMLTSNPRLLSLKHEALKPENKQYTLSYRVTCAHI